MDRRFSVCLKAHAPTFEFANLVRNVTFDTAPGMGHGVTFYATAFLNNVAVESHSISISGASPGDWATLSFTSTLDAITVNRFGDAMGVGLDNISFENVAQVPEPSSIAMLGSAALGLMFAAFRRRQPKPSR